MSHTYSKLFYHCIFSTKDRKPQIKPAIREKLYGYIAGVLAHHHGCLVRAGGTDNHVHLLINLDTTTPIAEAIRLLKANSSKWVHETFPDSAAFEWQTGYAAFTVAQSAVGSVIEYIDKQPQHHQTRTFEDEYRAFLDRHGIDHDERYAFG